MYKYEAHSSSYQKNEAEAMWLQGVDGQGLMAFTDVTVSSVLVFYM